MMNSHKVVGLAKMIAEICETYLGANTFLAKNWRVAIDYSGMDKGEKCLEMMKTYTPDLFKLISPALET